MIEIHEDDDMFNGSIEHYDSVGNQMVDFVPEWPLQTPPSLAGQIPPGRTG